MLEAERSEDWEKGGSSVGSSGETSLLLSSRASSSSTLANTVRLYRPLLLQGSRLQGRGGQRGGGERGKKKKWEAGWGWKGGSKSSWVKEASKRQDRGEESERDREKEIQALVNSQSNKEECTYYRLTDQCHGLVLMLILQQCFPSICHHLYHWNKEHPEFHG